VTADPADLSLLTVALDQAADLLGRVPEDGLDATTPCSEWTVGELVDHLVNAPAQFVALMRGNEPDWTAAPPHVGPDREQRFRAAGEELVGAWRDAPDGEQRSPLDWQLAELAVHTWDLATALGDSTAELTPEVADRGLAFMRTGLTDDNRGAAFGPEQPAPARGDAYARIAAFAGRAPWSPGPD
jgi:uncharacterized protein (TIGR03086 family)